MEAADKEISSKCTAGAKYAVRCLATKVLAETPRHVPVFREASEALSNDRL